MKNLDILQVHINSGERFAYKLGILVLSHTISVNFTVKQVNKYTYVVPAYSHPYIGQIAYVHPTDDEVTQAFHEAAENLKLARAEVEKL